MTLVLSMCLAVNAGRAAANAFANGRWAWPARSELFSSIPGVLGGDAFAGLDGRVVEVATRAELQVWICVAEVMVIGGFVVLLRWAMVRWGPGRILGMASAGEAEYLLGISRLRRNAPVVRPDLYGSGERQ